MAKKPTNRMQEGVEEFDAATQANLMQLIEMAMMLRETVKQQSPELYEQINKRASEMQTPAKGKSKS